MPSRMTVVLQFEDGDEKRINFEAVPTTDPSIVERLESTGPAHEREVVTTFRRVPRRPDSYPAGVPFVAGVRTHTNEYPGSDRPPRARWRVLGRSARVYREVERQSIEAGWIPDQSVAIPGLPDGERTTFLRRGASVRRISKHRLGWFTTLVELEDVSSSAVRESGTPPG